MDEGALHQAAYAVVRPRFEADREQAVERFQALLGAGDARAATGIEAVVRAAYRGRIDALLLGEGEGFAGTGEDLLDAAMVRTLRHGGGVHVLPQEEMPDAAPAAAILRY